MDQGRTSSTPALAGRGAHSHHRRLRAARAFAWVTQKMKAEFAAAGITTPLVTSNRINARGGRAGPGRWLRRHGVHGAAAAGRPRRFVQGSARPAPTASTPASPATRPAWTMCSRTRPAAAWSTRAPPRDRAGVLPGVVAQALCGGRRRPVCPVHCRHGGGRAWATRCTCLTGARHRRPVQHGQGDSRQEYSTKCALPEHGWKTSVQLHLNCTWRPPTWRVLRGSSSPSGGRSRATRRSPARTTLLR